MITLANTPENMASLAQHKHYLITPDVLIIFDGLDEANAYLNSLATGQETLPEPDPEPQHE